DAALVADDAGAVEAPLRVRGRALVGRALVGGGHAGSGVNVLPRWAPSRRIASAAQMAWLRALACRPSVLSNWSGQAPSGWAERSAWIVRNRAASALVCSARTCMLRTAVGRNQAGNAG